MRQLLPAVIALIAVITVGAVETQAQGGASCAYTQDGECDEPEIGTGLCAAGTDDYDCEWQLQPADTCASANDGTCDTGWLGTGRCPEGTDTTDCAGIYAEGQTCPTVWDGVCDEPEYGNGRCPAGTDKLDCVDALRVLNLLEALEGPTDLADSCRWARDGECDEPSTGSGLCAEGTDTADCADLLLPGDLCASANDGVCDTGWLGTGRCVEGTDAADCAGLYADGQTCSSYWDGVCDEPEIGTGRCPAGTDKLDCVEVVAIMNLLEALDGDEPPAADPRETCRWARDGECDEPDNGSGLCAAGTDITDCAWQLMPGDLCASANNGVCDTGWLGTGLCAEGTDAADCAGLYAEGQTCPSYWDGVCDEPGIGNGRCPAGTDKLDCIDAARQDACEDDAGSPECAGAEPDEETASSDEPDDAEASLPYTTYSGDSAIAPQYRPAIGYLIESRVLSVTTPDRVEFAIALDDLNDDGVAELFVGLRGLPDPDNPEWWHFCARGEPAPCEVAVFATPAPGIWNPIVDYEFQYGLTILDSRGDENYRDLQWDNGRVMRFRSNFIGGWYHFED